MGAITFLASLALLGAVMAAPGRSSSRIVGGSPTTIEEYPYMSNMNQLVWGIWWMQACGGSLITRTAVLSAAHCYRGHSVTSWRVLLGSSQTTGGIQHDVSQIIIHPDYRNLDADVAIIKLQVPATLSESVGVASIPGPNFNLPDNTVVTAIGWGALWHQGPSPTVLQHVDVNIINHELCTERYAYLKSQPQFSQWPDVTPGMVCAGILDVGGKDACQGDSGGPLAYNKNIVYGLTSWGFDCAHEFYPGVSARVSYYSDWIVANA